MRGVIDELVKRSRQKVPDLSGIAVIESQGWRDMESPDHTTGQSTCWCMGHVFESDGELYYAHRWFEN